MVFSVKVYCIQIVATFENTGEHDIKLLDLIAQELGLDDKEYQDAKHKYLRKPPKSNPGYVTYKNEKEIIVD